MSQVYDLKGSGTPAGLREQERPRPAEEPRLDRPFSPIQLMLPETIHRLSAQRATCRVSGIVLGVIILLTGMLGRLGGMSLVWPASPLLLLLFVDAGYAARQRRCVELFKERQGSEGISVHLPESAAASIPGMMAAVFSLSIWPFYLCLLGMVTAGAFLMPIKEIPPSNGPAMTGGSTANGPGQPYRQATDGPIPSQSIPQRPLGTTPFSMNPAIQRNGAPALPQSPASNRLFGAGASPLPFPVRSSPPSVPPPAIKKP